MLSSRLTVLTRPPNQTIAIKLIAGAMATASKNVRLKTKKDAAAREATILAIADSGRTSSYQPTANSVAHPARTGTALRRLGQPVMQSFEDQRGDHAAEHGDAAERGSRLLVPAIGPGLDDGAPPNRQPPDALCGDEGYDRARHENDSEFHRPRRPSRGTGVEGVAHRSTTTISDAQSNVRPDRGQGDEAVPDDADCWKTGTTPVTCI